MLKTLKKLHNSGRTHTQPSVRVLVRIIATILWHIASISFLLSCRYMVTGTKGEFNWESDTPFRWPLACWVNVVVILMG